MEITRATVFWTKPSWLPGGQRGCVQSQLNMASRLMRTKSELDSKAQRWLSRFVVAEFFFYREFRRLKVLHTVANQDSLKYLST